MVASATALTRATKHSESVRQHEHHESQGGMRKLSHESEVAPGVISREAREIREYRRHFTTGQSKPSGERCGVLIDRCGGNPAPGAGIVRPAHGQRREGAKRPLAVHGTADDDVMTAPAVITPESVRWESAAEIAGCEAGHGVHTLVKSRQRLGQSSRGRRRRCQWPENVWNLPNAGREWARRYWHRALDSHNFRRSVCRNAGQMVWLGKR